MRNTYTYIRELIRQFRLDISNMDLVRAQCAADATRWQREYS